MTRDPTVLVVDDDTFMRAALRRLFTVASIPVETFESASELLATGDLSPPAVLLLDVMMPGMTGLELQATLRERGVRIPVIFLTGAANIPMAVTAMRNGAVDFLEKPFNNAVLVERVRQTLARCAEPAPEQVRQPDPDYARRLSALTPREREVFERMIAGKTSKMIARELGGSFRTIEIHRARVMSKMAAASLADLVRMTFDVEVAA
jgi:FixJ family two-component response regulator